MKAEVFYAGLCAVLGAACSNAWAADALLPEVVVSATRSERDAAEVPVAIDSVPARVIHEGQAQINLSESLNRVPGISVLNRQNYAQDVQISLRGFGARSTFGVRGIRLIADGIPATSPDGQAQASSFLLSSTERIEVMRGPFSSLYGNAAGGVIQLFTADGPREPTATLGVTAGSYGTYKWDAEYAGQQGDVNYRFGATTSAYLFYSKPVRIDSYVPKSSASMVNPVHATAIWSLGLSRTF